MTTLLTDERIAEIYRNTFEATPGAARAAPKPAPLVIAFGHAVAAAVQAQQQPLAYDNKTTCPIPPEGWFCNRAAGHDGPCAAWPVENSTPPQHFDDHAGETCLALDLGLFPDDAPIKPKPTLRSV